MQEANVTPHLTRLVAGFKPIGILQHQQKQSGGGLTVEYGVAKTDSKQSKYASDMIQMHMSDR